MMWTKENVLKLAVIAFLIGCGSIIALGINALFVFVPTYEGETLFRITQAEDNNLSLSVQSERSFSCSSYRISHFTYRYGNNIFVNLGKIYNPGICTLAIGPATFYEELELENGNYTLEFRAWDKTDRYELEVTESDIRIREIESSFSTSKTDYVRKKTG